MQILNATPHAVDILGTDGEMVEIPPTRELVPAFRCPEESGHTATEECGFTVVDVRHGVPADAPAEDADTTYIVSTLTALALRDRRSDLRVPYPLIRDGGGKIIGAGGLGIIPPTPTTTRATPPALPRRSFGWAGAIALAAIPAAIASLIALIVF